MAAVAHAPEVEAPRGPAPLGVGVVVWLASELMFFAGLFAAYFALRSGTDQWPPEGVELGTARTAVFTALLVSSSFTMHVAVAAAERGDRRRALRALAVTGALGAAFIANQATEYAQATFTMDDHAYGSIFFVMTGFHGLHVIGGLGFMAAVAGLIAGRGSRAPAGPTMAVCGYYWHFVDVVWVAMFATIYLIR